ncbi:peptide-methionine (R)-S-oxide reductase MsrB [Myroides sp. LJL115]
MNSQTGKILLLFLLIGLSCLACQQKDTTQNSQQMKKDKNTSEEQWKKDLSPEQFYVLRQKGTEPPFSGKYNNLYEKGTYHCAGCNTLLFDSETKFDAHCGWPSFDKAIEGSVEYIEDFSHGMNRVEVICANCKGHLGHVFEDGPIETTGNRYCMNSVSLKFQPGEK